MACTLGTRLRLVRTRDTRSRRCAARYHRDDPHCDPGLHVRARNAAIRTLAVVPVHAPYGKPRDARASRERVTVQEKIIATAARGRTFIHRRPLSFPPPR